MNSKEPNGKYINHYLILPDGEGGRARTLLAQEYTDGEIAAMQAEGYVVVGNDDFQRLIGNADKAYSIAADGTLYETPERVPTAEEKLAELDIDYKAEFESLNEAILLAAAEENEDSKAKLIEEKEALVAEYDAKRRNVLNG